MLFHHHGIHRAFTGDYAEYMSHESNVDAAVYLMLANTMLHEVYPGEVTTIAEDVSGVPTLCRSVKWGGIGFDYRLHMGAPDLWVGLVETCPDEAWPMHGIVAALCNRRIGEEKTIAYVECHDQSIVGDDPLAFRLMGSAMHSGMVAPPPKQQPRWEIQRGISLLKLTRLVTMALGGEGYLNFMGNEFGHPDWIDFPRTGNNYSHEYCRRRFHLARNPDLLYRHLLAWDRACIHLQRDHPFMHSNHLIVSEHNEHTKVIVVERDDLIFVFNFHPTQNHATYKIGTPDHGRYKLVLDSDSWDVGGQGRVPHAETYFTTPETSADDPSRSLNGRPCSITLPILPSRTCQVYLKQPEKTSKKAAKSGRPARRPKPKNNAVLNVVSKKPTFPTLT